MNLGVFYKSYTPNPSLTTIKNTTGKQFNWQGIITSVANNPVEIGEFNGIKVVK